MRRGPTTLVLVLWILAGPLAMAFGPCAAMGMACDAACGTGAYPVSVWNDLSILPALAALVVPLTDELPTTTQQVPEPPPKQPHPAA